MENEQQEKKKGGATRFIAILLIIAAAGGFWYWNKGVQEKKAQQEAAARAAQAAPIVVLGEVEEADLSTQKEYVGSVEPIQTVNVVPSVTGKIAAVNFKEGSIVHAGQVLFTIEQKQYKATRDLRKAQVEEAKANLVNAESYLKRVKTADQRAVSASESDKANAAYLAAQAALASAQASLQLAQIDVERTSVRSPITGRIGKALFTKGNYVKPDSSPLAVVVQEDPIRVSFSLPDRDYLGLLKNFNEAGSVFETKIKLSNGDEIEAKGMRDFENNQVDSKTGTVAVRLRYANKDGRLMPGALVRVSAKPVETRLVKYIPQAAILADAQGDYVFTVNDNQEAVVKRVKLGDEYGTARFVEEGLEKGDKIIVQGIQMVRQGVKVQVVENQKSRDTAAEKAKESELDLKPAKDGAKEEAKPEAAETGKTDQKADQGKKVPAAIPPAKQGK